MCEIIWFGAVDVTNLYGLVTYMAPNPHELVGSRATIISHTHTHTYVLNDTNRCYGCGNTLSRLKHVLRDAKMCCATPHLLSNSRLKLSTAQILAIKGDIDLPSWGFCAPHRNRGIQDAGRMPGG